MGWPVGHSLSPRLHGYWLQHYHIAGTYEALPVPPSELASTLKGLPKQGLRGVNLTVPHKEAACALVDHLDSAAKHIGAVNLVVVDAQGQLHGRNTDAYGFMQNLMTSGYHSKGGAVFIIGAGGAARAAIVGLLHMGVGEIRLTNRTPERAEKLAHEFSTPTCKITAIPWEKAASTLGEVELLVNTTSLGMTGQPSLTFSLDALPEAAMVNDIVYVPLETDLLRQARRRGHQTIDGLGMLLHQARPSFEAFFGRDPEVTEELRRFVLMGKE